MLTPKRQKGWLGRRVRVLLKNSIEAEIVMQAEDINEKHLTCLTNLQLPETALQRPIQGTATQSMS